MHSHLKAALLWLVPTVTTASLAHGAARHGVPPTRLLPARRAYIAADVQLSDFTVTDRPQVVVAQQQQPAPSAEREQRPIFMYLPGIELSGYSLHRQIDSLSEDFEVQYLSVPQDDTTSFDGLCDLVTQAIDEASTPSGKHESRRKIYLAGESFGGVLALSVALRSSEPPAGLSGIVLINPATSVGRSWPAQLPALLDAINALPEEASNAAYSALATPILSYISGDPMQIAARAADLQLPAPLRPLPAVGRLASQLPLLLEIPQALPRAALSFRLPMLLSAAQRADAFRLSSLSLPVDILASTEDRVLPSVEEGQRLARALPNARLERLEGSGHVPLLEARVSLRDILRRSALTSRPPRAAPKPKDYVSGFTPPTAEAFRNASRALERVRRLSSPVFLSTDGSTGRTIAGLGGLPPLAAGDGPPVLVVGNHQLYGVSDLPLLVEEVHKQTGVLLRALAHPVIFQGGRRAGETREGDATARGAARGAPARSEGATFGGLVNFEAFGAVPANPRNMFKLLSRGEPTLLYPGGVREAFKSIKKGEQYRLFWPDGDDDSDFVPVAARFGATIVPVAAIGAEEDFKMILDADEMLQLPLLGDRIAEGARRTPAGRKGERFVTPLSVPKPPRRYYFLFGRPMSTAGIDPRDTAACAQLYGEIKCELERSLQYLLERREQDPYETLLPRAAVEASWNWRQQVPSFRL